MVAEEIMAHGGSMIDSNHHMKLTITKREFLRGLRTVSGAVARGATLPILAYVRLTASATKLELFCTDMDVYLQTHAKGVEVHAKGDCAVRCSLLEKIVADVDGDEREIFLETNGGRLDISTDTGFYKLLVLDADEFPPAPELKAGTAFKIVADQFYSLFFATSAAQSEDDSHYVLNGCDLELGKEFTAVATDGRRLMKMSFPAPEPLSGGNFKDVSAIIPRKAVALLLRTLADVPGDEAIAGVIGADRAQFRYGGAVLTTKLVEGNFPNYQQVIPKHGKRVILNRAEFLKALQRVVKAGELVTLELGKNLLRLSSRPEKGDEALGLERIAILCAEKLSISFNSKYLLDALSATADVEVALEFADGVSPLVVKSPRQDWQAVIMPMRGEATTGHHGDVAADDAEEEVNEAKATSPQSSPRSGEEAGAAEDEGVTVELVSAGKSSGKIALSKLKAVTKKVVAKFKGKKK